MFVDTVNDVHTSENQDGVRKKKKRKKEKDSVIDDYQNADIQIANSLDGVLMSKDNSTLKKKKKNKVKENEYINEELNSTISADMTNDVVSFKNQDDNKKKKQKHLVANQLKKACVIMENSEDQLQNPLNSFLMSDNGMAHKKKKKEAKVIEDTEKELKTNISADFRNGFIDLCGNQEDVQKKKKRKEKHSVADGFQNSDKWIENSLNTVTIPEDMTYENKIAKKNAIKHTYEELDITICGDMTNNVDDKATNQEPIKKKKKTKKEKQAVAYEFQKSDSWIENSLSKDNMTDKQKRKEERKKHVTNTDELNTTISAHIICDAVDKYENQEHISKKKRKKEIYVADEFQNSMGMKNDVVITSENQEGIRKEKKRKKEKHSVADKWIENSLDNVLMSEDNMIYEKKQKRRKSKENVIIDTNEELNKTLSVGRKNDVVTTSENQKDIRKEKKRKKEKHSVTDKSSDNSLDHVLLSEDNVIYEQKQKKRKSEESFITDTNEELNKTLSVGMTNDVVITSENQEGIRKEKKRKKEKHVTDKWSENSLDNVLMSEDNMIYEKKQNAKAKRKENFVKDTHGDLDNTIISEMVTEVVDLCEDETSNRKKRKKEKHFKSSALKNGRYVVEDNENVKKDVDEAMDTHVSSEMGTEVVYLSGHGESKFDKKKKRKEEKVSDPFIQDPGPGSNSLPDISPISEDNKKKRKSKFGRKEKTVTCMQQELENSIFSEQTREEVCLSSDNEDNSASSKRKKRKRDKNIANDTSICEKEKMTANYNSKNEENVQESEDGWTNNSASKQGEQWDYSGTQELVDNFSESFKKDSYSGSILESHPVLEQKKRKSKSNTISNKNSFEMQTSKPYFPSNGVYNTENPTEFLELDWNCSPNKSSRNINKDTDNQVHSDIDLSLEKTGAQFEESCQFEEPVSPINGLNYFEDAVLPTPNSVNELDFNEDPVDFHIPELHASESIHTLSKEQRDLLKSMGVVIKMGKWSKFEDEVLRKNYAMICARYNINDPYLLLGLGQIRRNAEVTRFMKAKHLYVRLGKDLVYRPLHNIYTRARTLFDPLKAAKKCTENDVFTLKNAHARLGNKWHVIGGMMEKNNVLVRESFRWNQKTVKKGKWTHEEEQNLINAIKTVAKTDEISAKLIKSISWEAVAKLVPTRNTSQCRLHYGECMAWNPNVTHLSNWDRSYDVKLIEMLKNKRFSDETEIDWEEIHKSFEEVAPSYMFLQKRWRAFKHRHLLADQKNNFRDMIEVIARIYL